MKYFMYCRKSSEEETKQVQSLDTQQRLLTDYAHKLDLEIVDVIREHHSAKDDGDRPLFNAMLLRIRNGEADAVLVVHCDRLARNLIEAGQIQKLIETGKLQELKTPSNTYNNTQSLLYMGFDFIFASHYSQDLSVKVKACVESKILKGEYPSWAPIGYVNKEGKIYPDEKFAPYIRMAYDMYSSGNVTLKEITEALFDKGFRTRGAGNKVHRSVIHRILKDPIYYGAIRRNGKAFPGIHKAIVSVALYNKVQQVFVKTAHPQSHKLKFLYRDYLTCAECGCKLTASFKKNKHTYYYCTNGKGNCSQHSRYRTEADVTDSLYGLFQAFSSPLQGGFSELALRAYGLGLRKQADSGITIRDGLRDRVAVVDEKISRLLDVYLSKQIDSDTFNQKQRVLLEEKSQLSAQLKQVKPIDPEVTLERVQNIRNKAISLPEVFLKGNDQIKQDLLKAILWNATIKDGEIISQSYKMPFEILSKMTKTSTFSDWRCFLNEVRTFFEQNPH